MALKDKFVDIDAHGFFVQSKNHTKFQRNRCPFQCIFIENSIKFSKVHNQQEIITPVWKAYGISQNPVKVFFCLCFSFLIL